MKLILTIELGDGAADNLAELMREEADRVDSGFTSGYITDGNGQPAGYWEIT